MHLWLLAEDLSTAWCVSETNVLHDWKLLEETQMPVSGDEPSCSEVVNSLRVELGAPRLLYVVGSGPSRWCSV